MTRVRTGSLPELFKRKGYWTGGMGKVFHGKLDHGERAWHAYHRFDNERNPCIAPVQKTFEAEHGSIDTPKNQRAWRAKLLEIVGGQLNDSIRYEFRLVCIVHHNA